MTRLVLACVVVAACSCQEQADQTPPVEQAAAQEKERTETPPAESPRAEIPQEQPREDVQKPPQSSPGPLPPAPWLSVEPPHLTSNTGKTPIRVFVHAYGQVVEESLMATLAGMVQLRTEKGVVPTNTSIFIPTPSRVPANIPDKDSDEGSQARDSPEGRPYVELLPEQSLESEWHEVLLQQIPDGIQGMLGWSEQTDGSSQHVVRFHPESKPVLRGITLCDKGEEVSASVEFSEGVAVPKDGKPVEVNWSASGQPCSFFQGFSVDSPQKLLVFKCGATGKQLDETWTVLVSPGLKSGLGVALLNDAGESSFSVELDGSKLPSVAGSPACREWMAQ